MLYLLFQIGDLFLLPGRLGSGILSNQQTGGNETGNGNEPEWTLHGNVSATSQSKVSVRIVKKILT